MTVSEALKLIHKRRCKDCACIHCEFLVDVCADPEIMEIVEALHLYAMKFSIDKKGNKIGTVHDRSGCVIYPKGMITKPSSLDSDNIHTTTTYLVDIGLLDDGIL